MPRRPRTHLRYRPALDGLRGVAVLAVLAFHLWPTLVPGGWLGVDLFFVLSGFLITSLLVREYSRDGRINLWKFWSARMRRLLPSLITVLLAVAVMMALWTVPGRRSSVGYDMLAALAYVSNWRLLSSNEAYFAGEGTPSPLRHTWSLGIEEQYYLLFPLLLLLLALVIHRRRHLAWAFLTLAGCSALWMAHLYVPHVDPTRVYYGTDTRAFELLIGAAAGAWIGPRQWGSSAEPARWVQAVKRSAWPSMLAMLWGFLVLHDDVAFLYRGGLVVFCFLALLAILTAASPYPSSFQRCLSWEPLRRLGLVSYALYLWHWPLHIFLTADRLRLPDSVVPWVVASLSLLFASLTYRYVELPVRTRGIRGLLPTSSFGGPLLASTAVVGIVISALVLPHLAPLVSSTSETGATGSNLVYQEPEYKPGNAKNVLLLGNSIPASLNTSFPQTDFPDLRVRAAVSFGCTPYPATGDLDAHEAPQKILPACSGFQQEWASMLQPGQTLVYFVPQNLLYDHQQGGNKLTAGTPGHDAWVRSTLETVKAAADKHHVHKLAIVDLACHNMPTFGDDEDALLMNSDTKVRHLNSVTTSWARTHGVGVIDQYSFLCPKNTYHGRINGHDLYADALHFTDKSGPIMWAWLAPQLQKLASK